MDLKEISWEGVNWTGLAKDRNEWRALVYMVINHRLL